MDYILFELSSMPPADVVIEIIESFDQQQNVPFSRIKNRMNDIPF